MVPCQISIFKVFCSVVQWVVFCSVVRAMNNRIETFTSEIANCGVYAFPKGEFFKILLSYCLSGVCSCVYWFLDAPNVCCLFYSLLVSLLGSRRTFEALQLTACPSADSPCDHWSMGVTVTCFALRVLVLLSRQLAFRLPAFFVKSNALMGVLSAS